MDLTDAGAGTAATRTQEVAAVLAGETLERALHGEDFAALVKATSDDAAPGIYQLCNTGRSPRAGEYPRSGMVPAFGNVGFSLEVGGIAMADFDPQTVRTAGTSSSGWSSPRS